MMLDGAIPVGATTAELALADEVGLMIELGALPVGATVVAEEARVLDKLPLL
jgi:hypothetical protein